MASKSDVKAFNHDQGDSAAVVGPSRSRIRQILIFGNSADLNIIMILSMQILVCVM